MVNLALRAAGLPVIERGKVELGGSGAAAAFVPLEEGALRVWRGFVVDGRAPG